MLLKSVAYRDNADDVDFKRDLAYDSGIKLRPPTLNAYMMV